MGGHEDFDPLYPKICITLKFDFQTIFAEFRGFLGNDSISCPADYMLKFSYGEFYA